ncbi:hypothetical protein AB6A40_010275 [Gnathostoma spinigerum]|uniref:Inosine/uridine-preferring nucleoside hydrolase domain-containing protein n=1 Tax=Gnathostoma spinigerum TaxID=75299 RepID=A0ABD6EW31_9BILA
MQVKVSWAVSKPPIDLSHLLFILWIASASMHICNAAHQENFARKKQLIIDTDGITDDMRALTLALQTKSVEVVAVTAVSGVVPLEQSVANIRRTLRANHAEHIPIYEGANGPLISTVSGKVEESFLFGKDGLGDVPDAYPEVSYPRRPLLNDETVTVPHSSCDNNS